MNGETAFIGARFCFSLENLVHENEGNERNMAVLKPYTTTPKAFSLRGVYHYLLGSALKQ